VLGIFGGARGWPVSCRETARLLPGYLDGAIRGVDHARIRRHMESCGNCRAELEHYRCLAMTLARVERMPAPTDLADRIRATAARERVRQGSRGRLWGRLAVRLENMIRPLAVPATGGLLTALLAFIIVAQSLLVGVPVGAVPNDLPTNLLQAARLESLAPFPVPGIPAKEGITNGYVLALRTTLDARGEVVDYEILSGPQDAVTRRQLDQMLLFSRFRPQMSFGRPMAGGHVMLSFSEVRVKG
jgi:Putative zinc-finger